MLRDVSERLGRLQLGGIPLMLAPALVALVCFLLPSSAKFGLGPRTAIEPLAAAVPHQAAELAEGKAADRRAGPSQADKGRDEDRERKAGCLRKIKALSIRIVERLFPYLLERIAAGARP